MSLASMSTSLSRSTEQPLSPKSPPPPGLLDFYGRRKQMIKIQVLEREIALLQFQLTKRSSVSYLHVYCPQEELKSLEGLHPASRCCKELDTFVGSGSDPFTPTSQRITKSHSFWKHIRLSLLCLVSLPWVCRTRCVLPKRTVKVCCGRGCCMKTKTVRSCCNIVKRCAYCLVCFSCECCVHKCCHRRCHQ
ncbi:guanine nucleotide-binding protein subunit gamma 3-like isoform X2 [Prosopis cineraria]|uniref:guanine nucleotide-binding protein subunit gamma 3-like isoform X2 n=1 Tax=Prosopis cineraria TaxID=364024 RepID=UPI00241067D9|nr:guanine nucleotide-binding protein subunit gamma 3-like isoform X2 [Prosopis cineraria]